MKDFDDSGTRDWVGHSSADYQARYRAKGRQLSVVLSQEAYIRLREIAARQGCSMGAVVESLVTTARLPRRRPVPARGGS